MNPQQARVIAEEHLAGRHYGKRPYFEHTEAVAMRVAADREVTPDAIAVAYLQDVVENKALTFKDLHMWHISQAQVHALEALTRREFEGYDAYIERCGLNPIARLVKYHDLQVHMDTSTNDELVSRCARAQAMIFEAMQGVVRCKICADPIVYLQTKNNRLMAVNRASIPLIFDNASLQFSPALGHEVHVATCVGRVPA